MKKTKKKKTRAKKALLTTMAATSLFVNNSYDSPFDIIDDSPTSESGEDLDEKGQKSSIKTSIRKYLGKIPLPVRCLVLLPLWVVGYLLMLLINPLLDYIIIPNLSHFVGWLSIIAIVLGIILVGAAFIFPGLPLKKILSKKTIYPVIFILIFSMIADKVLEITYQDYSVVKLYVKLSASVVSVITGLILIYKKNRKIKVTVYNDKYSFSQTD